MMNTTELGLWLVEEITSFCEVAFPGDRDSRESMVKSLTVSATFRPEMRRFDSKSIPTDRAADWHVLIKHSVLLNEGVVDLNPWVEGFGATEREACLEARDVFMRALRKVAAFDAGQAKIHHRFALAAATVTGLEVPTLEGNAQ